MTHAEVASFWRGRARVHGHTGWADPVIYAYDQAERLQLIRTAIDREGIHGGCALDFGCGTGDFSRLLTTLGFEVCAYDPFVHPSRSLPGMVNVTRLEDLSRCAGKVSLALSVTALDHILEVDDALAAIAAIRSTLAGEGVLLMLEYALDSAQDRGRLGLKNSYQAFRTTAEWCDLLAQNGLQATAITPAPHPTFRPSPGFLAYRRTALARLRSRLPSPLAGRLIDPWLRRQAARIASKYAAAASFDHGPSPLKLIRVLPL